jgi:hypothetical protein
MFKICFLVLLWVRWQLDFWISKILKILSLKLKGQCHEIFNFRFSTWNSFPQAHDYTIRAVLNFFEICRRYRNWWTGGKICRRCRWYRWQCRWYRWGTLNCEYLRKFSKKFETVLKGYSGAGGKLNSCRSQADEKMTEWSRKSFIPPADPVHYSRYISVCYSKLTL